MAIAWSYLSEIQIAQLLHFRPELREEYEAHFGIVNRGGRPKSQTLDEIKQRAISRVPIIKEEERLPNSLNSLKGLWELNKLERGGAEG